ncbi:hypothetical protein [Chromobacterium rhizoryzae]|uniref:hypothetical protein n=1 Tax=Chromobacterium rhizoryzae TaxID=1778675 RepID=UPI001D068755|nr:hypothetical protein [Chromobacterium rhizoryzae]
MMKLLIQHNEALKGAARLIVDYEMRLGVIALKDSNPLHPDNTAAVQRQIKRALADFYYWSRWQGEHEPARAALLAMWASGKWSSRDLCAQQCYLLAGFRNVTTARLALVGAPIPDPDAVQRGGALEAVQPSR